MNQQTLCRALSIVAMENKLKLVSGTLYADEEGERYVLTPLGYRNAVNENFKHLYMNLQPDYELLVLDHKNLKSNYKRLITSQEVTSKQTKKLSEILNQKGVSSDDILKQAKKYLNI